MSSLPLYKAYFSQNGHGDMVLIHPHVFYYLLYISLFFTFFHFLDTGLQIEKEYSIFVNFVNQIRLGDKTVTD